MVGQKRSFLCNPGSNPLECFWRLNQILEADCLSFYLAYGGPGTFLFWKEYLPGLWTLSFMLFLRYFYHPLAGPWRRKRHFEAINVPLLANEDF